MEIFKIIAFSVAALIGATLLAHFFIYLSYKLNETSLKIEDEIFEEIVRLPNHCRHDELHALNLDQFTRFAAKYPEIAMRIVTDLDAEKLIENLRVLGYTSSSKKCREIRLVNRR